MKSPLPSGEGEGEGETLRRLKALAVPLWLALTATAFAHELGTIRVNAEFRRDGTYAVDCVVDREHLPPGFASEARYPPKAGRIRGVRPEDEAGIGRLLAEVADHVHVTFDGAEQNPGLEWFSPDPDAAELTLRLSGAIPAGASLFAVSNDRKLGSYLLTVRTEGVAEAHRQWQEGGEEGLAVVLSARVVPPTRRQVAWTYLKLGFTHILPKGTDHILFVLGIFLLSIRLKPVLLQVTAFTVAHTITLALTIYGVFSLKPSIVEPLIAVSIVFVAVENILSARVSPWRVAVVFGFGLLHGMGFAGVLSEQGLPRTEFLTALLSFNLGVEGGQLAVILSAFLLIGLPFRNKPWYRRRVVIPASAAIALVGLYWAIQRTIL
jgi:hydrogenase/urease accessory protein HupE